MSLTSAHTCHYPGSKLDACRACMGLPPVVYHPWVCAQCWQPISNAQASLSVKRRDGASCACKDCVTRELTVARQLQEAGA